MRCRLISVTSAHLCRCLGLAARSRRLALTARLATLLARFAALFVCLWDVPSGRVPFEGSAAAAGAAQAS